MIVNRCRSASAGRSLSALVSCASCPFVCCMFTISMIVQLLPASVVLALGAERQWPSSSSLTGCNLTGENAPRSHSNRERQEPLCSRRWEGRNLLVACRTTIGECVFIVMQKSQEGGVRQRETVLKLCRGDRSNLAVKCLPVLHCWQAGRQAREGTLSWLRSGCVSCRLQ